MTGQVQVIAVTGDQAREAMKHARVYAMLRTAGIDPLSALHIIVDARRGNPRALHFIRLTRKEMRK